MLCPLPALADPAVLVRRFAGRVAGNGTGWPAPVSLATANEPVRGMVDAPITVSTAAVLSPIGECAPGRDRESLVAIPGTILPGPAAGPPLSPCLRLAPAARSRFAIYGGHQGRAARAQPACP